MYCGLVAYIYKETYQSGAELTVCPFVLTKQFKIKLTKQPYSFVNIWSLLTTSLLDMCKVLLKQIIKHACFHTSVILPQDFYQKLVWLISDVLPLERWTLQNWIRAFQCSSVSMQLRSEKKTIGFCKKQKSLKHCI